MTKIRRSISVTVSQTFVSTAVKKKNFFIYSEDVHQPNDKKFKTEQIQLDDHWLDLIEISNKVKPNKSVPTNTS